MRFPVSATTGRKARRFAERAISKTRRLQPAQHVYDNDTSLQ